MIICNVLDANGMQHYVRIEFPPSVAGIDYYDTEAWVFSGKRKENGAPELKVVKWK